MDIFLRSIQNKVVCDRYRKKEPWEGAFDTFFMEIMGNKYCSKCNALHMPILCPRILCGFCGRYGHQDIICNSKNEIIIDNNNT